MEEGLNFKRLIEKFGQIKNLLLSKWKVIVLVVVLGAALGGFIAKKSPTTYTSKSSFMVTSSKGGGGRLGSLLGMASSLGLGVGDGSMTVDNVSEIIVSERIVLNTLLAEVEIEGKQVKLGNYFIDSMGVADQWLEEDYKYKDIRFTSGSAYEMSPDENVIAKRIIGRVKRLLSVDFQKQTGIIRISASSEDELFSYHILPALIGELTEFYVDRKTENERETFKILVAKSDSIRAVLERTENELALLKDQSYQTVKAVNRLKEMQLEREVSILSVMYSTGVSNVEMARVNLLQETPFIQVIDQPFLPLKRVKKSFIVHGILFAFLFGFLIAGFYVVRLEIKLALK